MVRFHALLRCLVTPVMLYNDAVSTGESLYLPCIVCKFMVCWTMDKRKAKGIQAVGWPDSTDEGGQCRQREAESGIYL